MRSVKIFFIFPLRRCQQPSLIDTCHSCVSVDQMHTGRVDALFIGLLLEESGVGETLLVNAEVKS